MAGVCETPLWDVNVTWDTPDPDFTPCFQKAILALIPCYFLLLVAPLYIGHLWRKGSKVIPWGWLGVLKLVVTGVLMAFAAFECIFAAIEKAEGEEKPPIDFLSPLCIFITMIVVVVIIQMERKRGVRTSGVLVIFWLLFLLFGIIRLRSVIKAAIDTGEVLPSVFIHYPCLLFAFILSVFVDRKPEFDQGKGGQNPCPEKESSFLSRITFWWFSGLVVLGYKRPLTQDDLWTLNREDQAEYVAQSFYKKWNLATEVPVKSYTNGDVQETNFIFKFKEGSAILAPYAPGMDEVRTPKRRLFSALVRNYYFFFLKAAMFKFLQDCLVFVSPQLLKMLIRFTSSEEYTWRGYFYASLLLINALVQSVLLHQYFHATFLLGMRLRSTIVSVIYRKTLRLSNAAKRSSTVGEIVNLMSVDAQRFMELTTYIHMIWSGPFQISVALFFLWQTLGPSALAGIAVMILLVPLNGFVANKIRHFQVQQMQLKDSRIKLMNEILNGIKVLKLYAWEKSFQEQVLSIRNKELSVLKKAAYLNALSAFFWTCAPVLVSVTTFGVYVLSSTDNVLDAEKAFVSLALFNILRFPLSMVPNVITNIVQANVSLKRLQRFVDHPELDPQCVERQDMGGEYAIRIEGASFSWEEDQTTLSNINMNIETGSLVAVVGVVGAGKSSLLAAMLGEMEKSSGNVSVGGSVSYVAQQAWIQNATLQDNILFNKSLNQTRYDNVVEACALRADLDILPAGDKTEIGEKGINLSGGQKQRVSLARAVYQDTDIYLLDDPLSAVDSHVGKHLFDNVIGPKGVLQGKTRVLVTHGISFLPFVDKIFVLVNGRISEAGSFQELMTHKGAFSEFLKNYLTEELKEEDGTLEPDGTLLGSQEDGALAGFIGYLGTMVLSMRDEIMSQLESSIDDASALQRQVSVLSERIRSDSENFGSSQALNDATSPATKRKHKKSETMIKEEEEKLLKDETKKKDEDKLVQAEGVETGRVKFSVFMTYVRAVGPLISALVLLFYILNNATSVYSNIWLSQWSDDARNPNISMDADQRDMRLGVYGALGILQGICLLVANLASAYGRTVASSMLHTGLLLAMMRQPLSFFDTTPLGRVINRFSKDVETVDTVVPLVIMMFMGCVLSATSTLVVISVSTPIFLAIIVPMAILYYFVQRFYVATSRQLKRLESISRSPIYSHFGESITGAVTIRAYGQEARFIQESQTKVDNNQICYFPSIVSNRWLAIRLEMVGNFIVFFASLFAVLGRESLSSGIVGLSVSYAMNVTQTLNWMVRMTCELETNIVSVERIKEYTETPTEADWIIANNRPAPTWPEQGVVEFKDYKVRYREGLDLVLKGINCTVKSGEKVGIVGRTGAGKSSLTLALFRIIEAAEGSITVDGIDISTIGLHDLRSKLTIIPQDPVLFSGTLRMNLDPFESHTDEELWSALEHAHLKTYVSGLAQGLLYECTEGGENLSVGQRQLVCLARALLRKTQVLILDEATAAVDLETDDLIQSTIRTEFEKCTVLTIAHRLNTILDYTRIMVLDQGRIKEFNSPQTLLQDRNTVFYGMAKDAGLV